MKCDTCIFQKRYTTGIDEYPQCTTFEYCSKGHWEGSEEPDPSTDIYDNWINCTDYKP